MILKKTGLEPSYFIDLCMNESTFIIRVDSSSEIGMGHLIRCLTLAIDLDKLGATVVFICRDHYGSAHNLVLEKGFKLHLLDGKDKSKMSSNPEDWLGCTQSHDAFESSNIIDKYKKVKVIVDHYALDYLWESKVNCNSMIVIDDLANRRHQCELLIDQSLKNTKSDYEHLINGNFDFIGGKMVILREEFSGSKTWSNPGTRKVLICMGGADPFGYTQNILGLLIKSYKSFSGNQASIKINIIIGEAYKDISHLTDMMKLSDLNISLIKAPRKVSELMLKSDLCILSCGTMILEACALGVPSIGVVVADNQESTAKLLYQSGAIELCDLRINKQPDIYSIVLSLIEDPKMLSNYSLKQKEMVSHSSSKNIARNLYDC